MYLSCHHVPGKHLSAYVFKGRAWCAFTSTTDTSLKVALGAALPLWPGSCVLDSGFFVPGFLVLKRVKFPGIASRWRSDPLPGSPEKSARFGSLGSQKLWQGQQFIWKCPGGRTISVRGMKARDESHSRRRSKKKKKNVRERYPWDLGRGSGPKPTFLPNLASHEQGTV